MLLQTTMPGYNLVAFHQGSKHFVMVDSMYVFCKSLAENNNANNNNNTDTIKQK